MRGLVKELKAAAKTANLLWRRCACASLALTAAVGLAMPSPAHAQAWLPYKGEGTLSFAYTFYNGGDHLFPVSVDGQSTRGYVADDKRWFLGDSYGNMLNLSFDYGLANRVAIGGSVAYAVTRYDGLAWFNFDLDDGDWHGTFQDVGFEVRAMALQRPLVITPLIGMGGPLDNYPTSGHAAAGRGLNEFRVGAYLGWQMSFLPSAYLHGSYVYGIAEEVNDVRLKRGVLGLEAGYFLPQRLSVSANASFQDTYGGLEWASADPDADAHSGGGTLAGVNTVSATRFALLGFGAGYSLGELGLYASWSTTVWGENVEDTDFLTVGTSWSFSTPFAD
jgi:hypothetical protein